MSRPSTCSLLRTAAIGALVAALGLAGCGRKGGLDPPPGSTALDPVLPGDTALSPAPPGGTALSPAPAAAAALEPGVMPDGRPLAPPAPRRRTFLDFLID